MEGGEKDGVILTTDADSQVAPNWIAPNLAAFVAGVIFRAIEGIVGAPSAASSNMTSIWPKRFDAGHQDSLRSTIRKLGRGVYRGAEAQSVGEAVGEQAGCAFEMIDLSALRPYPKMRDAFSRADKADREEH